MLAHALIGPLATAAGGGTLTDLAHFLAFPPVAALLVAAGFLGVLTEFKTGHWGLPGSIAVVALGLFFWSHIALGYASWQAIFLVGVGFILLALEIFVIPGFGIAGTLGLVATFGGIFLALVGNLDHLTKGQLLTAGATLGGAVLLVGAGGFALVRWLPESKYLDRMTLKDKVARVTPPDDDLYRAWQRDEGAEGTSLVGHTGVAVTDLRPVGTAEIDGAEIHVMTRGSYVDKGTSIEVVEDTGYRRVVRPVTKEA